jgi:endonuclease YncB( thermonuclease family)
MLTLTLAIGLALQGQADVVPKPFDGRVVAVADGDTITVLYDTIHCRVRLAGIDAPERGQAFGAATRKALADKVAGQLVTVEWRRRDRYGHVLGDVYLGKRWINLELVREGLAWHYKRFSRDKELAAAERAARAGKRGLWGQSEPLPPWEYRKRQAEARRQKGGSRER